MNLIITLNIPIEKYREDEHEKYSIEILGTTKGMSVKRILSKSLDIRNMEQFYYKIKLAVSVYDGYPNKQKFQLYDDQPVAKQKTTTIKERPIIVGFGPAGMFAALELIDSGVKPIIFERGKKINERTTDVQRFIKERVLNPESNIQFGEGGAGSYSDGKLFSRRNKNTSYVNRVLKTFVKFGAPKEIEYISKPHLGTDILCKIVRNIRHYILEKGGEILYGSKMTDILLSEGKAIGIVVNGNKEFLSSHIFLALGHSARDTYSMMHKRGIAMEQRPISIGVRIEHPVQTINLMRYGKKYKDFPEIGAATYSLNYTNRKIRKGVYTFCMCPGGEIINASSGQGLLVLNGMSYSRRSSPYSNAALTVTCHTVDYKSNSPLAGIDFQKSIEKKAFNAGGGQWHVPAQNLMDFLGRDNSTPLHSNSYKMGAAPADMREIFPHFIIDELVNAFTAWQDDVPEFVSSQALLFGAETRTSSPVRVKRNEYFESVNVKNLYPIGEGSGYTGGITSSAADAVRAVEIHTQ